MKIKLNPILFLLLEAKKTETWEQSIHFLESSLELRCLPIWEKHYLLAPLLLDRGNSEFYFKACGYNKEIQLN